MDRFDPRRQALAVTLACLAGYVDAIGFQAAGGYFVSFMSGNTTRAAVHLAGDAGAALLPVLLIAGFVAGVAGGTVLASRAGARRKPVVLGAVAALLALAAALQGMAAHAGVLAALVLGMGALNCTFQRDGGVAVGLTYMTGALVRLGEALGRALTGDRRSGWRAYGLLWLGLAGGAVLGAIAWNAAQVLALWPAAVAAALLALATRRL